MAWYFYILIIVAYCLLWFLTTVLCRRVFEASTTGMLVFLGFIWPITIPLLIITAVFEGISWFVEFIVDLIKGRRR